MVKTAKKDILVKKIDLKPIQTEPVEEAKVEFVEEKPKHKLAWLKWVGLTFLVLLILFGSLAGFGYTFYKGITPQIKDAAGAGNELVTSVQAQDLVKAKEASAKLKAKVGEIQNKYQQLAFLRVIPILGTYVSDGQHGLSAAASGVNAIDKLILAVEPYSDLLGFKTDSKNLIEVKSIEDRIVFMVNTLGKISPQLESISSDVTRARDELDKIDPKRYPETFMGKAVRGKIVGLQDSARSFGNLVGQAKPLIDLLPALLGDPDQKTYMLLFQNNGELRPTGGFLTAYAHLRVSKGRITPLNSFNIYDLDARFVKNIPPPNPIVKYLNEKRWNLRNMNMSPDFKVSMDTFTKYIRDINGLPQTDGIIALDTEVPVKLLEVLGTIGVGGWGNFSAKEDPRCKCPQVVYFLEDIITKPVPGIRPDRKAVLGPLMHSILANAMGSPKHMWPKFLNIALDAINQKHLMFYFFEEKNQKAAESFNAAGRIGDYDYDYLHLNDSNFGGAKSDLFIKRDIEQEITTNGDKVTKKVTITYNNPEKGSNCNLEAGQLCLNGVYRDYVRLYVPKGSKLTRVVGSEVKETTFEDLGKTVFDAFFTMRPESSSKLVFEYELPALNLKPYRMLIQKQPGVPSIKQTITLDGKPTNIDLITDKELVLE
ncbi:hypothetical protein A3A84_01290 [Candidatus Collierbacteria bacterium RIFCSPLOWO2_01_FULL_50_23]|uniref:DUF4012 domain-containing protein n=1 Tax=Candidatus Collierbacteria bacterium RIFCSPHIGHO2_01_FULL_50_25 TaxID=1817722 RepID=A0A1F5EWL4_9BACT|nr:MAG: hypothetical protein A2703_03185 [Candidatus Collierbacteria bacterium RIFCSPHIGHO2_01_FULL_50_25]OGD74628.1 MAG: hypothetical protein A3A84_01290 [Candidatus Collierbacteria bacterium RIFCSPLOWO2_01_FULL_50_23]